MPIGSINYIQADENLVGENHPLELVDTVNRPVKELKALLEAGTDIPVSWDNITDKPSPVITITLIGDVTGEQSFTLSELANGFVTINTTLSVTLPTKSSSNPLVTSNPSALGYQWINYTTGEIFICTDITTDANVWVGTQGTLIPTP